MKRQGWKCPHCGNRDEGLIQTNLHPGDSRGRRDEETLLCVALMKPEESTFSDDASYVETANAEGLVACGMQWDPMEEER